jgi:hypothetical protein
MCTVLIIFFFERLLVMTQATSNFHLSNSSGVALNVKGKQLVQQVSSYPHWHISPIAFGRGKCDNSRYPTTPLAFPIATGNKEEQ